MLNSFKLSSHVKADLRESGRCGVRLATIVLCGILATAFIAPPAALGAGKLLLRVVDAASNQPVPFRLHLKNEKGIAVKVPKLPFWHDHVVVPGTVQLELFRGNYFFEIDHGPEYQTANGYFTINDGADDEKTVTLKRIVDMGAGDWWAGDLDIRRPQREVELAMQADELHIAPLTTWTNRRNDWAKTKLPKQIVATFDRNRFYQLMAGLDDRNGGPLALLNLPEPLPLSGGAGTEGQPLLPLMPQLGELKSQHKALWVDVAHPGAWDLPILLAQGKVDSYRVLASFLQRDKVDTAWQGRPFDKSIYRGYAGPARFAQDVYFHMLNVGLRVVPSAGSGSGTVGNPAGYNRTYVWVEKDSLSYDAWWESFKAGMVVVTNGPLIQPRADGKKPGAVFTGPAGAPVTLEMAMDLATRDRIAYVEVIQNGKILHNVPLRDWAKEGGRFPTTVFHESGWCLIRAQCENETTYRAALTAPWYVEIDGKTRVSRNSAQFFLDWLEERAAQLKLTDAKERQVADTQIAEARSFWRKLVDGANAP
ncbi:MAG: hypothetical protein K8U03_23550 [Planctomycetia bacterium]|nr:hypothetical protein [Planctomycetia bacterium]